MERIGGDIFERIQHSAKVDFGQILGDSFTLFGKVWVQALLHALIALGITIPFVLLIYVPLMPFYLDLLGNDGYFAVSEPFSGFTVVYWIGYGLLMFIMALVINAITVAIAAHFMKVLWMADSGQEIPSGGYLDYLKGNFNKLIILSLASMGIALLAALLCYLPIFYVMVPLQLLVAIFAFNSQLSVSEIIRASFKLGNKYWLTLFGLIIISSLIAQLGVLLCLVGVFITAYFIYVPLYLFYRDSVGIDASNL